VNSDTPRICALLPAYNEAKRIGTTIDALLSRREIHQIVVVDDGSSDGTADVARKAGATTVITQANAGKGAALRTAYQAAKNSADIFLLLDSDLGASATESVKLLPLILSDSADMTIGRLPPDPDFAQTGKSGGMGFVVRLARWGIHRRTGQVFAQPLSGQRALRRAVLESIDGNFAPGFGVEVALTIKAIKSGYRVSEVDTEFRHHVTASDWSGLVHRGRQFLDVARIVFTT
jgi:glycosyltransferase involved in cell wall biosynthesis